MKSDDNLFNDVIKNSDTRVAATRENHLLFFHTYFSDHVTYQIAPFHQEMFRISEDEQSKFAVLVSFRGSGKSTLMTLSYPLWAILGRMRRKFIVIISQTQDQARQHFKNIKLELEHNELLKQDLGPFQEQDEWNNCSLIIPKYNAKIIAVSRDQSFRGVKFGSFRPDLIIADDCEDAHSVKSPESRKSTRNWFLSEVLPLGDISTKIVVVGNLLHDDSLIMNLQDEIARGVRSGVYRRFPLLDGDNNIAWPGKYPDQKAIEAERMKIANRFVWAREYLLEIIEDSEPIVPRSWIQYYDELPTELRNQPVEYAIGVDLAISERDTACYTALVSCKIYNSGKDPRIYILPHPINKRMSVNETRENIRQLVQSYGDRFQTSIYVEDVMLQGMLTKLLSDDNFRAEGLKIGGMEKKERLHFSSSWIQEGRIFFPREGCEQLIKQITEFETSKYKDLCDAFTTLILKLIEKVNSSPSILMVNIVRKEKIDSPEKCHSQQDWSEFIDNETRDEFPRINHRSSRIHRRVHRGAVGMGIVGCHSYEFIGGIPRAVDRD